MGLWEDLKALADPKAPRAQRRRGLGRYALGLLLLRLGVLLLLAPWLPRAEHPALWPLALLGGAWLLAQAQGALKERTPLAPALAIGFGAGAFFFLGLMGLLLSPWLWAMGILAFLWSLRRALGAL